MGRGTAFREIGRSQRWREARTMHVGPKLSKEGRFFEVEPHLIVIQKEYGTGRSMHGPRHLHRDFHRTTSRRHRRTRLISQRAESLCHPDAHIARTIPKQACGSGTAAHTRPTSHAPRASLYGINRWTPRRLGRAVLLPEPRALVAGKRLWAT